jgi:hypothetical protein
MHLLCRGVPHLMRSDRWPDTEEPGTPEAVLRAGRDERVCRRGIAQATAVAPPKRARVERRLKDASTKLAKKCQGQGSNREARCADRLLNEIRNIAFAGRVDNDVGPSHSTIERSRPRPAPTTAGCRSARRLESSVPGDRSEGTNVIVVGATRSTSPQPKIVKRMLSC